MKKIWDQFLIKVKPVDVHKPKREEMTCYNCGYSNSEDSFIDLQEDDLNCPRCRSRNVR